MRGVLSPPNPTPSRPVGGEVVEVSAPNPVCVVGFPGMPASTMLGRPKFGWLNTLKNCTSNLSFNCSVKGNSLDRYKSLHVKLGPRSALRPRFPNWQFFGLLPAKHAPVLGSTAETKAAGLSH